MGRQLNISRTNYSANLSCIGLYREQASWQSTKEIDTQNNTHSDSLFRPIWCPTTLNLPYSEREIKIEGFGGRPLFGGRPGALGPMGPPKSGPEWSNIFMLLYCEICCFHRNVVFSTCTCAQHVECNCCIALCQSAPCTLIQLRYILEILNTTTYIFIYKHSTIRSTLELS